MLYITLITEMWEMFQKLKNTIGTHPELEKLIQVILLANIFLPVYIPAPSLRVLCTSLILIQNLQLSALKKLKQFGSDKKCHFCPVPSICSLLYLQCRQGL